MLVNPQATWSVRPSTTKGVPGSVAPITFMPLMPPASGACRCAKYQMAGALRPRCGSLASSGWPVSLREPATTQLLEPLPSMLPSSLAQSCMSRPICAIIVGAGAACDEVWADSARYTPSSRYRRARSACAAGGSPGYGGNSCHSCAVSSTFKAESRASSLPQLPPRSSAIMSAQPALSSGSQYCPARAASRGSVPRRWNSGDSAWSLRAKNALTPSL
ncbi:hypothetical protein D9M69_523890 [compost metagenome]